MKKTYLFVISIILFACVWGQKPTTLTIHIRGINSSDISIQPFIKGVAIQPVVKKENVQNGQTVELVVPKEYLPGEFVIRYDYKQLPSDQPYPSEQRLIINKQSLKYSVNPPFCNNKDSMKIEAIEGLETENSALRTFQQEFGILKSKLVVLQQFLMSYDETSSSVFKAGLVDYENRRTALNSWLKAQERKHANTFIKSSFCLNYIPEVKFTGDEKENAKQLLAHYFDGINFADSNVVIFPQFANFLNNYVNMSAQMLTKNNQIDSLYTHVAVSAIEAAKKGHPICYGWVVDYYYMGFEKNSMTQLMPVLVPYIQDPNCKTVQRIAIEKRLQGLKSLTVGKLAPNISYSNSMTLHNCPTPKPYKVVLFWSADCGHCLDELERFYPYSNTEAGKNFDVFTVSVDETSEEINKWEVKKNELQGWIHKRGNKGIESDDAENYFVLSTPSIFVIDATTNKLAYLPNSFEQLKTFIER